tara:strand:+ start:8222 stop:10321 length:2100 start_codon:yes stop_codon:yes gene_type:complete
MAKKKVDYTKLEKTLRQASKAAAAGWSQEKINQYILDKGYKSMKAFENAVVNRASIAVRKNIPSSEKGVLQGYAREVANGLTMGLWGQGESLVSSIVNGTPWAYEEDLMQTERAEYQDDSPVNSTIANIGGAAMLGGGLAKAAITRFPALAPVVGSPIANFSKEAGLEAGLGAVEGGVTALAEGGDVGTGVVGGSVGGVAGTGLSRLIDPAVKYAKQGLKKVNEMFDPTVGDKGFVPASPTLPENRALDKLDGTYADDGTTVASRESKIQEFENVGMGDDVSPSFLGGPNVNQMAKNSINETGPQKQIVTKSLEETLESNRSRVQKFMDDGLGYNKEGAPQHVDQMMEKMSKAAEPKYNEAFESGDIQSDVIDEVMAHKEFRKAYEEAQDTNRLDPLGQKMPDLPEEGVAGTKWSVYALDQVKKIIDLQRQLPPSALNAPNKKKAKHLGEQTTIMLGAVDDVVPSYGEARKIWSGGMDEVDAYELGKNAYNTGKKATLVEYEFSKLNEAEKKLYRLGASTEAIGKMDQSAAVAKSHSKVFDTPDFKQKHKILFGNPEEAAKFVQQMGLLTDMSKSANAQMPRSDTGANIINFIRKGIDLATTTSGASGAIQKVVSLAGDPLRTIQTKATNKAVGEVLAKRGAKATRQVEKQLANRKKELSSGLLERAKASGGITGAAAHLLGRKDGDVSEKKSLLSTSN